MKIPCFCLLFAALLPVSALAEPTESDTLRRLVAQGFTQEQVRLDDVFRRMRAGLEHEGWDVSPYVVLGYYYPMSAFLAQRIVEFCLEEARAGETRVRLAELLALLSLPMDETPVFTHITEITLRKLRDLHGLLARQVDQVEARFETLRLLERFSETSAFASAEMWKLAREGDPQIAVFAAFALLNSPQRWYSARAFSLLKRRMKEAESQRWVLSRLIHSLERLKPGHLGFFRALGPRDVRKENREYVAMLRDALRELDGKKAQAAAAGPCGAVLRLADHAADP